MNLANNFWVEFPELTFPEALNKLYEGDKSLHKQDSSKLMWAVYLVCSPDSIYYNHPDKLTVVARDFLKQPKFKWSSIKEIVNFYKAGVLTIAQQSLNTWNEMMVLRDTTLKDLYRQAVKEKLEGLDDLVTIDKMMSNTAKMFADYKKIKDDFETDKLVGKQARNVSAADRDDM